MLADLLEFVIGLMLLSLAILLITVCWLAIIALVTGGFQHA